MDPRKIDQSLRQLSKTRAGEVEDFTLDWDLSQEPKHKDRKEDPMACKSKKPPRPKK
jgi:hypothetical protein